MHPSAGICLCLLWAGLPAAARGGALAVELQEPSPRATVKLSVPFVEVVGRARLGELVGHDVVIALDLSESSHHPVGTDLDGDGNVGKLRMSFHRRLQTRPVRWTTDPEDTVIAAELAAARIAVERLGGRGCRLGLITFSGRPRTRSPVGTPAATLEALDGILLPKRADLSGSNLAAALTRARDLLLQAAPGRGARRPSAVLLLTDGDATAPHSRLHAEKRALRAARELAARHIPVYSYAFGEDALEDPGTLPEISARTGGRFLPVEDPRVIAEGLPEPLGLERVAIRNLTTEQPARALRTFADGSFDAFAPLAPGENLLEVTVLRSDGRSATVRRRVLYEAPTLLGPAEKRDAARLLVELRRRTAETELARGSRATPPRRRSLEVEMEGGTRPCAGDCP